MVYPIPSGVWEAPKLSRVPLQLIPDELTQLGYQDEGGMQYFKT